MNNFKICVYAIAKNEEKFALRWLQSMSEADEIVVLDTGSTDKTVEILSNRPHVRVVQKNITPWRFDTARNESLSLVPEDIDYCVCTDLDEVFNKGWRKELEKALSTHPDKVSYRYTWSFSPETVFNIEKIHTRHGFLWTHPVHEVLSFQQNRAPVGVFAENIHLYHYPDSTKSRAQYLPLLEQSVKESPEDDRNMHYLGREYMFHGKYEKAVQTLKKHLSLKSAVWKDERCASMRYIAACLLKLQKPEEAFLWLLRACAEAPYLREPWQAAAERLYEEKDWYGVIFFTQRALKIINQPVTYITDVSCYKEKPHDLLSIAYYYVGNTEKALEQAEKALEFVPDNERIKDNIRFFKSVISK